MSEARWRNGQQFYAEDLTIFQSASETTDDDGSKSISMGFPVCEVSEWVKGGPAALLLILNAHDNLVEALDDLLSATTPDTREAAHAALSRARGEHQPPEPSS